MLTINANNVGSNVKGVICLVIEEVNGQTVVSTHGTQKLSDVAGLFSAPSAPAMLAAAPSKPVEIIPTTPVSASNEPTLAELKAEAKRLGIKGWQLPAIKAETLKRKIAEKNAAPQNVPQQQNKPSPAPSAPQTTTFKPRSGGGKPNGKPPMKKDSFKLSECWGKAVIYSKDRSRVMDAIIAKEVQFSEKQQYYIDENVQHGVEQKNHTQGFIVCVPDEGGVNKAADTVFGATWIIPTCRISKWLS